MVTFSKSVSIGLYIIFIALVNGFSSQELFTGAACPLLDGTPGVCKSAAKCKWLKEQISARRISLRDLPKLRCTFEGNDEITCCGDDKPVVPVIRPAIQACELYKQERQLPLTYHILGGNFSLLGEFPHMAALGYMDDVNNQTIDFKCGGSLISQRYILTAAHCSVQTRLSPVVARLGTINLVDPETDPAYGEPIDILIAHITLHPDYLSGRNYHDLALVYLAHDVVFNANLHPACLRTDLADVTPNEQLLVTGWGRVDANNDARSNLLLKANLTSVSLSECNITLKPFFGRRLASGLNGGQLCAADPAGLKDACQGDSGGPIQILEAEFQMPYIVGVTSFGISCGTTIPSVYARVAYYVSWIESIVWPN